MPQHADTTHDVVDLLQNTVHGFPAPNNLIVALLAAEDHRFTQHQGIDFFAVVRATVSCCIGRREGGSTIEQQLARTLTRDRSPTLARKLKDWIIAVHISKHFTKPQIATAYLDVAYFGYGIPGYRHAASKLGIDVQNASIEEACSIAALLKRALGEFPTEQRMRRFRSRREWLVRRVERFAATIASNSRKSDW